MAIILPEGVNVIRHPTILVTIVSYKQVKILHHGWMPKILYDSSIVPYDLRSKTVAQSRVRTVNPDKFYFKIAKKCANRSSWKYSNFETTALVVKKATTFCNTL